MKRHSVVEARIMTALLLNEKPLTYYEIVEKLYGDRPYTRTFEEIFDFLQERKYIQGSIKNNVVFWTVTLNEFNEYLDFVIKPKGE